MCTKYVRIFTFTYTHVHTHSRRRPGASLLGLPCPAWSPRCWAALGLTLPSQDTGQGASPRSCEDRVGARQALGAVLAGVFQGSCSCPCPLSGITCTWGGEPEGGSLSSAEFLAPRKEVTSPFPRLPHSGTRSHRASRVAQAPAPAIQQGTGLEGAAHPDAQPAPDTGAL